MSSYLSVLSAIIRPEIKEKISIGLLLISDERLYLGFSKNKLEVASQLLPEDVFRSLRFSVKSIQKLAADNDGDKTLFSSHLTVIEKLQNTVFSKSYLNYISNYKNNVISVSAPNSITIETQQATFEQLFKTLVDEQGIYIESKKSRSSFSALKDRVILRDRFNQDLELNQDLFPCLIVPVKLDFVGKNEREIFVKIIELEKRKDYITNDVSKFNYVKDTIPLSERFVVSREPFKSEFPQQHQIWKNLQRADWFSYIDISEIERLENYAEQHDVQKLVPAEKKY